MDVYGRKPTAPEGEYFRRNIWGWHPLAELCIDLAPDECRPCKYWHSNDGKGLNAAQSLRLAERLQKLVADGSVADYIVQRDARLAACPQEERGFHGSISAYIAQRLLPAEDRRSQGLLDLQDVTEFISFLRASGGFRIF
jgi:hypothetical protein